MAPQQMMQCPHGVHVDQCDICTDRRMHYLRRVAGNSRVAGSTWNTISRSTLQRLANTVYPEGHMVHNQNIGNLDGPSSTGSNSSRSGTKFGFDQEYPGQQYGYQINNGR